MDCWRWWFPDIEGGDFLTKISISWAPVGAKKIVLDSESGIEYGDVSYHDYEDDTEQNIGEIDADLFSPNYLSKAELRHLENIRSWNEEIDNQNSGKRNSGNI